IQLRFSGDQNVVLAHMLAGEAQVSADTSMRQAAADTLAAEWARTNGGTIINPPSSWRAIYVQMRPELADPRAVLDARVRKAIAHAVDKQALNDGIYGGKAIATDTPIYSGSSWGEVLDESVPAFPFDLRTAESLLNQAGFAKGPDGLYRGAEGRLSMEFTTSQSPDAVRELLAMANALQAAGLDIQQRVIPTAQAQDSQLKATFPAVLVAGSDIGEAALNYFTTAQIPSASNLWQGLNRGGWSSSEYDRLLAAFNTSLGRPTRVQLARQLLRVWGEDEPVISLFFPSAPIAYVARLHGPTNGAPESSLAWNIHL